MKQMLGFGRGTRTALTRRHGTVSWIMGADLRGEAAEKAADEQLGCVL